MASITHGGTLPDSSQKTDFYAIIDNGTVTSIVNADIGAGAAIADSKLAAITTASKVNQSAIYGWLGALEVILDGGGIALQASASATFEAPFSCTLTSAKFYLDTSTETRIDVWKDTYANYPPTITDTIVSSAGGDTTFSTSGVSATKFSATIDNDWTKTITANDVIKVVVESNDLATKATVVLNYVRP